MNLMNLFNFKYLMQNIKKSKGLIILLMLLVPMFTSILLLSADGDYALTFAEVSMINIIGMYIIPIVLSITLFSYVYKKSSVDFIGSMPISRKNIFITNTIGGISIIAIMQLITLIFTAFLSKVLSDVIIFGSMAWDIFVFYTIAYIFVFIVSNLAMSFSGNKLSQLVATCLILFLVPFLILSADAFGDNYSYINLEESLSYIIDESSSRISIDNHYHFTAPSYMFDIATTNFTYEYSSQSILKMIVLSIIYFFIGLFLFKRKKLEMAGESYEKIYLHLVIKMLTFVPFMFVYCSLGSSDRASVFLFFVAILAVYYFIFDLITNKKIKLKISIPAFIVSAIIVFAVYEGIIPKFGKNNVKLIKIDDIQSVTIESINKTYRQKNKFGLIIEDKNLINLILQSKNYERYDAEYYSSKGFSEEEIYVTTKEAVPIPSSKELLVNEIEEPFYQGSNAELLIKTKNGRTYTYNKYINANVYENIIEKIGNEKVLVDVSNSLPLLEGMHLSKSEKNNIIEITSKELANLSYEELYGVYNSDNTEYTLKLYKYENHELIGYNVSFKNFKVLYQYMAEICNKFTLNVLDDVNNFSLYSRADIYNIIRNKRPELFSGDTLINETHEKILDEFIYCVFDYQDNEVVQFIKDDSKNKIDINNLTVVIRSYYPTFYYTNDLDGLYELIAKSFDEFVKEQTKYYQKY